MWLVHVPMKASLFHIWTNLSVHDWGTLSPWSILGTSWPLAAWQSLVVQSEAAFFSWKMCPRVHAMWSDHCSLNQGKKLGCFGQVYHDVSQIPFVSQTIGFLYFVFLLSVWTFWMVSFSLNSQYFLLHDNSSNITPNSGGAGAFKNK